MKSRLLLVFVALILLLACTYPALAQNQSTITIKDYEGINPLPGAKLVIANVANLEDKSEFIADGNGIVTIGRVDSSTVYIVEVYWKNPNYGSEEVLVFQRMIQGAILQSISEIRTHVFNVNIIPTDKHGNMLSATLYWMMENTALAYLDGVKKVDGEMPFNVRYELVPQGKHRLRIDWNGYTVYDGEVEIGLTTLEGYIPGIDDPNKYEEELRKATNLQVETNTDDLEITVVDPAGNPVNIDIEIIDPNKLYIEKETGLSHLRMWTNYKEGGRAIWPQLPILEYKVLARWPFNISEVLAEDVCTPGQPCKLALDPDKGPYYTLKVRVVTAYGAPVQGAEVELSGWVEVADANGTVIFTCIRPGTYTLRALLEGKEVYPAKTIEVNQSTTIEITLSFETLNVNVDLVTVNMRPYEVYWSLDSDSGAHFDSGGRPSATITIDNLPPGIYELKITIPEYNIEYKLGPFIAERLATMDTLILPIADTVIKLVSPEGEAVAGHLVKLCIVEANMCFENKTDEDGKTSFVNLPQDRLYNVTIFSEEGPLITVDVNITSFMVTIEVPSKPVSTLPPSYPPASTTTVTVTEAVTQTVTTTKEVTITSATTYTVTSTEEAVKTVTETVTEAKTAKEETSPLIQIALGIAIVVAFFVVTIALMRKGKQSP